MIENKFILSSNKILSLGIAVADTFAKPINKFPKWNTLDTFSEIKFSAGGFRDFTRIAASDAIMWRDIFLNNKKNLLKTVNEFEKSLNLIKQYIKQNKSKKIQEVFIKTKKIRKLIQKEKQE